MSAAARILVATEVVADAELVRKLLRDEFEKVVVSTDPDRSVADFDKCRPEVLVLAFDSLEKAERYYLGLYRLSSVVHTLPHRTVILCNKDDLRRVYELCKKEHFDDYVLFWPMSHDATRLPMAVHHALRLQAVGAAGTPTVGEFAAQARRLAGMEALLAQHAASGREQLNAASDSLERAQQGIGLALDDFSSKLSVGALRDLIEVKDPLGFQLEIDRLKTGEITPRLAAVAAQVRTLNNWAGALTTKLASQVESVRALQSLSEHVRPLVLIVDDDEFQHKLLRNLLQDANVELGFANSGSAALAALRRRRPDLVLMDVDLPDIDGVEVTRRIKSAEAFAAVPIVMITGHSGKEVVVKCANAGASGFLVKPFDKPALLAKIRSLLGRDRAAAI